MKMNRSDRGISLLETVLAIAAFGTVSVAGLSLTVSMALLEADNRKESMATIAAQHAVESVAALEFEEIFYRFNGDDTDDPEGVGTALGGRFLVSSSSEGEAAIHQYGTVVDPDALTLTVDVQFPVNGLGELSEEVAPLAQGMPTDLNANGEVDGGNQADKYKYLPCIMVFSWDTGRGPRSMSFKRVFTKKAVMTR